MKPNQKEIPETFVYESWDEDYIVKTEDGGLELWTLASLMSAPAVVESKRMRKEVDRIGKGYRFSGSGCNVAGTRSMRLNMHAAA